MDPVAEVSHRMLGGAPTPPADDAIEGSGAEIAQVGVSVAEGEAENPPAAAPLLSEGNEGGVLDKQEDGAAPTLSEANMDVDAAPLASEGNEDGALDKQQDGAPPPLWEANMDVDAAPLASEGNDDGALDKQQDGAPPPVREANMDVDEAPFPSEGNEDGVLDKQQDGVAPAVSEANMDVNESSFPREDTEHHAATESKTEVNECGVLEKQQDVAASVMGKTKIVVDESSAPQQDHTVAAAPSEGDSRVVDQHPNTSDGGFPVKKDEEGECLVGRYISSSVSDDGRICLGKVASYDGSIGVYNVVFEDGQREELLLHQLREVLMAEESSASGMKMSCRKRKLDLLVSPGSAMEMKVPPRIRQRVDPCKMPARPDALQETGCDSDISGNAASSSNSSVSTKELSAELCPPVQGPELPPSSADIAVPEESISHLFSVYNFLRSFNVQLFLSPFGLDDFVASINCTVQNTLLDAVHVSLLQALRRHLETKSSGGSELASNCLKYVDWALLDVLTWPTFLLEYLYLMGYIKSLGGKSFGRTLLAIEYYKLPVAMKLRLLQILCDHVTESGELKAELEAREGYNEETEYETDSRILSEAGSRAVLTRASKASVSKKVEGLHDLETTSNVTNPEAVLLNPSQDSNSDDCRICGMDGTLVCCDGCPWAYHSRCIGLNKAFLPQGLWFCPECVVNKLGPASSRIERGARGAQMFGIDMCGRLFLGSCNYLLVIGTSTDAGSYARYYNQYDVVKVMRILAPLDAYTDICMRITEYWRHLLDIFQNERSKIGKEAGVTYTTQSNTLSSVTPTDTAVGSVLTTLKDAAGSKTVVTPQRNVQHEIVVNQFTLCSAEHLEKQECMVTSVGAPTEKNNEVCRQTPLAPNDIHNTPMNGAFRPAGISSISHENRSVVTGVSSVMPARSSHVLVRPDFPSCGSGIDSGLSRQDTGNTISVKAGLSCPSSYKSKYPLQLISEIGSTSDGKSAKAPSFKPQAYMNLYNHGNVAASAAANLAILTSEEGKVSVSQLTTNLRKKMAADCALQVKAFSSPAAQFIWPSTEKKIMEVPRDRCGWCIACKISAAGAKKACFLNVATANAAKGSARILSAMHVIKSSGSHFPSIAAYIVNMEESLRGLLVGSLQDTQQRQRWHKQLQEASNCKTIVPLLLELESNICSIAFSPIWVKLVDDWPMESPPASAGALRPAAYQKRGTGGRRGRKRSVITESAAVADDDKSWKKVNWWSGGNISKRILQRGVHLSSAIRKAARQGGKKRMAGLSYHDCSILPRRTRQFAWRACVGLSQNSSQLALQVRYLDAHIRWKEFLSPDQIPSDGRSSDADFSALRNAVVCDKKIVDNKIRYALKFPNQKHLPVRVTKNILEAEGNQDQNGKFWFSENHVPLYMVREFEQKPGVSSLPTPGIVHSFMNLYKRRVKASTGDVFSYLFHKGDIYPCSSCKKDVPFRDVIRCSDCQGYCHKECTVKSVGGKGGTAASSLICKLCLQKRNLILTNYSTNARYALPQKKSTGQLPVSAPKIIFKVGSSHSAEPAAKVQAQPVSKVQAQPVTKVETWPVAKVETLSTAKVQTHPITELKAWPVANLATQNVAGLKAQAKIEANKSKSEKPRRRKRTEEIKYFGLSWKKNKGDRSGSDFRANDVILKCKDGIGSAIKPTCCLCKKSYCPDFLYVRCEQCKAWVHGDALRLEEDRILEVVQYRCCKCRRRAMPICPHSDDYKKPEPEFSEQTVATSSQSSMLSSEETASVANQDPLLASYGIVEPIGEETFDADLSMNTVRFTSGTNQKLTIRRAQGKNSGCVDQAGVDEYSNQNQPLADANVNFSHMNGFSLSELEGVDPSELLGWDLSQGNEYSSPPDYTANCQLNGASCGSAATGDFEPQTFFSFTDLLEADDTRFGQTFGMSAGLQDDGNCTGSFDQEIASFDDMAFMVEDVSSNMHFPANAPPPDDAPCKKCNNSQPPPDLKCLVCGLCIHRQCSPWDESDLPVESADWACGACREWR
ncbi:DDT domain-containing protein PTM-like [Triticum dicoccoides]|uniref:DDT domain-containing protein PTM-like n=1 Tax=Triticum dicoccoides TaxID=85692 RepID=UPI000E7ABA42|nr:DDT domain-containing protein PTM-like [Triticum dicoccoides]